MFNFTRSIIVFILINGFYSLINAKTNKTVSRSDSVEGTKTPSHTVTLADAPPLWPGHLKPLGSTGRSQHVETHKGYIHPPDFLNNYAATYLPVLFKASEQTSLPYTKWSNVTYFTVLPQSFTHWKPVSKDAKLVSFRKYLLEYADKGVVYYHDVPDFLRDDVNIPKCIVCDPVLKLLSSHRLWISHKDHSSQLQRRNKDVLHCTYVGTQSLILISHIEYGDKMPPNFEKVDVNKVDFDKFPTLREVEYHKVDVKAGDCVYIPTKWYWQVTSFKKTYAVDIEWYHRMKAVKPNDCKPRKDVTHLKSVKFLDVSEPGTGPQESDILLHYFSTYLINVKKFTYKQFDRAVKKDKKLMEDMVEWTEELQDITKEVFQTLDVNLDGIFSLLDLESLNQTILETMRGLLVDRLQDYEDILKDQQDELKEGLQQKAPKPDATEKKDKLKAKGAVDEKAAVDEYLKKYIGQLEDVLRESIDEMGVTGKLPDIKQKFAEKQAKGTTGTNKPGSGSKAKQTTQPKTEREKAKEKLELEREKKKQQSEKEESEREKKEKEETYTIVDDSIEEEILADDEDDVKPIPAKKDVKPTPAIKDVKPTPAKKDIKPTPTKKDVKPTPAKKGNIKSPEVTPPPQTNKENTGSSQIKDRSKNGKRKQKTEL